MIPQDAASWLPARVGSLGASQIGLAIKKTKSGWSDSRTTLAYQMVAERVTGVAVSHFVTDAMQWGLDHENAACELYEAQSGNLTAKSGWFQHPKIEFFGATPDRLIDSDGLLEAKCPSTVKYIQWRKDGEVPDEHKPQMLAQLACTGRKYVDFVAYDPRIQVAHLQLFVRRFEPPQSAIVEIEEQAKEFLAYVEKLFQAFTESSPAG